MLGIVYCQQGKHDDAISALTRSIAIDPSNHEAHNFLGIAYTQKGDLDAAQKELLKAVELSPEQAEAHYNLAVLFTLQKPPYLELARKHYKEALALGIKKDLELEKTLRK